MMRSFKHNFLSSNDNIKLTQKCKHFQTFSMVEPKLRKLSSHEDKESFSDKFINRINA